MCVCCVCVSVRISLFLLFITSSGWAAIFSVSLKMSQQFRPSFALFKVIVRVFADNKIVLGSSQNKTEYDLVFMILPRF